MSKVGEEIDKCLIGRKAKERLYRLMGEQDFQNRVVWESADKRAIRMFKDLRS